VDVFNRDKPWTAQARPGVIALLEQRLRSLGDALADQEWLAGSFSVADILMVTVLRNLPDLSVLDVSPGLSAYIERGEQRPAFQRALADQCAGFRAEATAGATS
jgi:glutathione S-transferase